MKLNITLPPKIKVYVLKLKPIVRHHYFIVPLMLFGGVAIAVYLVNQTLAVTPNEEYRLQKMQSTIGSKFNKETKNTIEKIKSLHKSTDAANAADPLPSGRINPFAE